MIIFEANHGKAVEVIIWMIRKNPVFNEARLGQLLFFADKDHLSKYGRPIIGGSYIKTESGQLKLDVIEKVLCRCNNREPDFDYFSETDMDCLNASFEKYGNMTPANLSMLIQNENSFILTDKGGRIDYALMVADDIPNRDEFIKYIEEAAFYIEF